MQSVEMNYTDFVEKGIVESKNLDFIINDLSGQTGFSHTIFYLGTIGSADKKTAAFSSNLNKIEGYYQPNYIYNEGYGSQSAGLVEPINRYSSSYNTANWSNSNLAIYTFYGLKWTGDSFTSQLSENSSLQKLALNSVEPTFTSTYDETNKTIVGIVGRYNTMASGISHLTFGYAFVNGNNYLNSTDLINKYFTNANVTALYKKSFYPYIFADDITTAKDYSVHSYASLASWNVSNSYDSIRNSNYKGKWSANLGTITFGTQEVASTDSSFAIDNSLNHITDTNMVIGENSFEYGFNFNNTSSPTAYNEFSMYYISTNGHCADGYIYSADKDSSTGKCYLTLNNRTLPTSQNTVKGYKYTFDVMGLVYSSGSGGFGITDGNGQVATISKIGEMSYSSVAK